MSAQATGGRRSTPSSPVRMNRRARDHANGGLRVVCVAHDTGRVDVVTGDRTVVVQGAEIGGHRPRGGDPGVAALVEHEAVAGARRVDVGPRDRPVVVQQAAERAPRPRGADRREPTALGRGGWADRQGSRQQAERRQDTGRASAAGSISESLASRRPSGSGRPSHDRAAAVRGGTGTCAELDRRAGGPPVPGVVDRDDSRPIGRRLGRQVDARPEGLGRHPPRRGRGRAGDPPRAPTAVSLSIRLERPCGPAPPTGPVRRRLGRASRTRRSTRRARPPGGRRSREMDWAETSDVGAPPGLEGSGKGWRGCHEVPSGGRSG
jgi:hypothetical protein